MEGEQKRHYLITGATGFIGRHLCNDLCRRGASVTALTRNARRARRRLGDVNAVTQLEEIPEDRPIDAVVNLAGENLFSGPWTEKNKRQFLDSRVCTTEQLVEWMRRRAQKPEVLVSGSAIGFYGDQPDHLLQELDEPGGGYAHELTHRWESAALQAEESGVRVCLLRTGLVLGHDGGALGKMLLPFRLGLGGRLGSGEQWMSWIHIDDEVRLIEFLADHATLSGPFNATSPNPVTNAQFTETLARRLHRPAFMHMPAFVLRLLLGELADELLLASQRVLPAAAREAGFVFHYPELEGALEALLR